MAEEFRVADNDYVDVEEIFDVLVDVDIPERGRGEVEEDYAEQLYYGDGVLVEYGAGFRVERADVGEHPTLLWTAMQGDRNELVVGGDMDDRIYTEMIERGGIEGWLASRFADFEEIKETIPLDKNGVLDKNRLVVGRSPERGLQMHWQEGKEDGPKVAVGPSPYVKKLEFDVYVEPVEEGLAVIPLNDDVTVTVEETYRS